MADNFSEINENFDTIKTLLNSIRAQGILNTSDVDKLLEGINSKLEKINTEEDIDLIKAFLSELKKNLDERHEVLISKFGAIESLFSNLMKNSTDTVKSSELKELFDIVATNLSVFSREVVSHKENLENIKLRLDAIQSDDSQKKDIIKNITFVRNDIEKVNNAFDSVVISLNENFKTVLKTIAEVDQSDAIKGFSEQLAEILNSSNTILSAIQLIDKKNVQIEDAFEGLATQDDLTNMQHNIAELSAKSQEIINIVDTLTQKSYKIDNLAEKIDASVNIIAGLKSELTDKDENSAKVILDRLFEMENSLKEVSSNTEFENLLTKISDDLKAIDVNSNFQKLVEELNKQKEDVKEKFISETDKISQLLDFNITRTLNDISSNAEVLNTRLKESHSAITNLCEKSFYDVTESISSLKSIVTQLDENNVSANNAIFSNITDRLAIFENSLKTSLEKQEDFISGSTSNIFDQITGMKNIAEGIDYKLDANAIELGNTKREFNALTQSVNSVLELDFVKEVEKLKVDLYAAKQDLSNAVEAAQGDLAESLTKDLYGKYELLVSKLDDVEEEVKYAQADGLNGLQNTLSNISSSIVDILSYVSTAKEANHDAIESKLSEVTTFIQDTNLNYIESVRDVVDVIRLQIENNLKHMNEESNGRLGKITSTIIEANNSVKDDLKNTYNKLLEVQENLDSLNSFVNVNNKTVSSNVDSILESADRLKEDFDYKLAALKSSLMDKIDEFKNDFTCENADKISELKFNSENLNVKAMQQTIELKDELKNELAECIEALKASIEGLNSEVHSLSKDTTTSLAGTLAKILDSFVALELSLKNQSEKSLEEVKNTAETLTHDFDTLKKKMADIDTQVDRDLAHQINIIEGSFESLNLMLVDIIGQAKESLGDKIKDELSGVSIQMKDSLAEELEQYKTQIVELFDGIQGKNNEQAEFIKGCALELNNVLAATLVQHGKNSSLQLEEIGNNLKEMIHQNVELTSADYEDLKIKLNEFTESVERQNNVLVETIRAQLDDITKFIDSNIDVQAQEINYAFEDISKSVQNVVVSVREFNTDFDEKISNVQTELTENTEKLGIASASLENKLQFVIENELTPGFNKINEKLQHLFEESMMSFVTQYSNSNTKLAEDISSNIQEFKTAFSTLIERLEKNDIAKIEENENLINDLQDKFNSIVLELKDYTRYELASAFNVSNQNSKDSYDKLNQTLLIKTEFLNEQIEKTRQNTTSCKEIISGLIKEHFDIVLNNIEKETDIIVGEIVEEFELLKNCQKDDISSLSSTLEGAISGYIIDAVNDLKSYFDVKTDTSVIDKKLDTLRSELTKSVDDTTENLNRLLEVSVFTDAITDLRETNKVLIETMTDKLNNEIQTFVKDNVSVKINEKLNLLDKKFIDTIVDKYEEVKVLSTEYHKSFGKISDSVGELITKFVESKNEINDNLKTLLGSINHSVDELKVSFAELKSQIMNKSFDEAFHASVHNQISGIENLVKEQIGYIEDISDLCCANLPELTEMSIIVKHGIQNSVLDLKEKLGNQEVNLTKELNSLKSEIITQFINIFNQISFVAEQEEILDFIQEKHSELITILSHIVNTVDVVEDVKDNLQVVDNKIDLLKEDIDLINEKITSIMSSNGDIDYVYSLQDLESDIANLRLVLNEMKNDNKSKEFEELISSTNNIYQIVETIKSDLPKFEAEEFKKDFNNLAEDIVSISTRTNKLILTSDESYKTLQDNLQDFKLVIDDLDERTRNFAHESGIDKLDYKLASINTMIQNGAKTNQVFNQVFEYLAEWVDKAGEQISTISDKVETLDDISQIKVMIEDLRAESHDTSYVEDIVSTLETVFDKQAKRISSLETKLDKMIVASNVKSKKSDIKPLEDTLNSFLVSVEDKILLQQDKINSLEKKLEEVVSLVDNKDTVQLTKKVGGMDKQLAKLNKSIEKIASNVVEK